MADDTTTPRSWDETTLLAAFDGIRCFAGKHGRAPHKPLLLLFVLARLQRGDAGRIEFSDVEEKLQHLLEDFGPPGAKHPEYPFWRLRSDGIWLVESAKGTDLAAFENSSHDVPVSRLRDERASGRLSTADHKTPLGRPPTSGRARNDASGLGILGHCPGAMLSAALQRLSPRHDPAQIPLLQRVRVDSGSSARNGVEVQVLSFALRFVVLRDAE